ncbi:hypothetical protein [Aeromonas jandaei]|uniref:hypothetical protein n=1 Tax=Aeromonas jandaei TaxID=650 RepID=UPI001115B27D|nr:hypothetical protein [Aeromonas jandaei]TNH93053.1 hypothetical protein CF104_21685 [Aeromonas jandaei]
MITATSSLPTHRHQRRQDEPAPREELVERFRSLLGAVPLPPVSLQTVVPDDDAQSPAVSRSGKPLCQTGGEVGDRQTSVAPSLPDDLQLRAATGPLAGLMINAGWQGSRLVLRLGAPSAAMAQRLSGRGKALEETLTTLLAIPVTVEVEHEE